MADQYRIIWHCRSGPHEVETTGNESSQPPKCVTCGGRMTVWDVFPMRRERSKAERRQHPSKKVGAWMLRAEVVALVRANDLNDELVTPRQHYNATTCRESPEGLVYWRPAVLERIETLKINAVHDRLSGRS